VVYGDKTLALTLAGKRSGISRKHFLSWAAGMGLTERASVQVVDLALKAAGPLLADLEAGAAFATTHDGGGSPFPDMVTRAWVKELKHRRRLLEG
jgi:serine/threonine-protein kinase HipA